MPAAAVAIQTTAKVSLTPLGLDVLDRLTLDDWRDLGTQIGSGARSMAFVIGDWLVYAEGSNGRGAFEEYLSPSQNVPGWLYAEGSRLTGMDVATLANYAYVARNVPRRVRNDRLSWEHHKKTAKLRDDAEKVRWLKIAAKAGTNGQPVSTRRLARSIEAGRLLSIKQMQVDENDRGIMNIHPFVNSICAFFGKLRRGGWFETATPEKRAALKRDLQPVVDLWAEL